jgi:hypothetical protein
LFIVERYNDFFRFYILQVLEQSGFEILSLRVSGCFLFCWGELMCISGSWNELNDTKFMTKTLQGSLHDFHTPYSLEAHELGCCLGRVVISVTQTLLGNFTWIVGLVIIIRLFFLVFILLKFL